MAFNLKGKSFLKLLDFTPCQIRYLLDLAKDFKNMKRAGVPHKYLEGKNVVLLFEKTSTRTRCSFEVAGRDLGLGVVYLDSASSQLGRKESLEDTARVLGRLFDAIEYRGYGQQIVEDLAKYSGVPVWNGLTDEFHPTQMLADMLTIEEKFGRIAGINITYVGDARFNTGNSLLVAAAKMGMYITICTPEQFRPNADLVRKCKDIALANGGKIKFSEDVMEAATGADVVYTDVWVSMGESEEVWEERINALKPYQVNSRVMAKASKNAIFMHCLPAFHDLETETARKVHEKFGLCEMEVDDGVFKSRQSAVFDEAENRMHTIKAVMYATLS